jgi:uncharacterized protein with HEPN domain
MRREKADPALLLDMLNSAMAVISYVSKKTLTDYLQEPMLRDAVERRVENIGEAARRLSVEFRENHPEIPWRPIIATRHILSHEYGVVNNETIWRVATVHVPELCRPLKPLIPPIPPDPEPESS